MILLVGGPVVVLELKGKVVPSAADIDQARAYARDLRCYHRACADRQVHAVVVPTRARGYQGYEAGVHIAGPDALDRLVADLERAPAMAPIPVHAFLAHDAYRPLPTLVQAARELFQRGDLRRIHRARARTEPAVQEITRIIHEAARTHTRRLVLLTGVPGSGKTLVGLQVVHAHFLDDLAVARAGGRATAPAVFLSGNGPLVEVLQYELREAGGAGKVFVRGVKDYVRTHARSSRAPPEHVLVFDEAQRAFDAEQVRQKHQGTPGFQEGKSEPEHFIEFAARIPGWCVVLGLIGGGQEIHVGEEAGLGQWRQAIERTADPRAWTVHGAPGTAHAFAGSGLAFEPTEPLNLDQEIRFHFAGDLHRFVANLLDAAPAGENAALARDLEAAGYALRLTRDFDVARNHLQERYAEDPNRRFCLIASSKDRDLGAFGIPNDFQSTKRVRVGPWYGDPEDAPSERSCRLLRECVTEFGAQGLELDAALLAWGTDLQVRDGRWSSHRARGYRKGAHVKDPFQLRLNAYRVLLTRGRDGTVVFVPPLEELDATYAYLRDCGFRELR